MSSEDAAMAPAAESQAGDGSAGKSGNAGSKANKSSSSDDGMGVFGQVVKWSTLVCCLVMAVVLAIQLLVMSGTIGKFIYFAFFMLWMLIQGLVDFGLESLEDGLTKYAGFMSDYLFRGIMLIVVALVYCPQNWDSGWLGILTNIGSLLLMVGGILNIVYGSIKLCSKK